MVAVIKTGSSIRRIFQYNEQKVAEGLASCLLAANYPKDTDCLTTEQKLRHLLHQAALNEQVRRISVHISLNFHPSEELSDAQMREIALYYMERIGFGEQPFLVYRHEDAGHPHLHLVSVKVRADGSRIDMHNIGRNQSESARKEIEQRFGLVRAETLRHGQNLELPTSAPMLQYGRVETKKAIQQVLGAVVPRYHYTSLAELNAVLGLYRVRADQGGEGSRIHRHRGLVYRVLDAEGRKVGVPIKASDFHLKPTLAQLEHRFAANKKARLPHKAGLRQRVELALWRPVKTIEQLHRVLEKEGIHLVLRRNEEGKVYGLTYVDHRSRSVFNGSTLGKRYSAQAVLAHITANAIPGQHPSPLFLRQAGASAAPSKKDMETNSLAETLAGQAPSPRHLSVGLLETLLQAEQPGEFVPFQLKRKRRKKRL